MSEPRRTEAAVRRTWWPGWIWGVPIAAVLIVGWLGLRTIARGGVDVTVTFPEAADAQPDAKVFYRGLAVGQIDKINLVKGRPGVVMHLHLDGVMKPMLRQGTRFYLVGAHPDLADLSSLRAVVSGPTIGVDPGPGAPTRHFVGLSSAPQVHEGERGAMFLLTADRLTAHEGSEVQYRGQKVGVVASARYAGPGRFVLTAFIREPYDQLVHAGTRFWSSGAVQVSTGGGGVKARLSSLGALVDGAVAFDTPPEDASTPLAAAGAHFTLYPDEAHADAAVGADGARYVVFFDGAVGGLSAGAPVTFRGFRIGEVTDVRLVYDPRTGQPAAPVTLELDPARLGVEGGAGALGPILARWVGQGLRAELVQDPPVIGGRSVALKFVKGARPRRLASSRGLPQIPAAPGGADLAQTAGSVMAKLDALPIAAIGENVRATTAQLRSLTGSPKLADSLDHLDSSLREVDRAVHEAGPNIGPTVKALRRAADNARAAAQAASALIGGSPTSQDSDIPSAVHELTEAARAIRSLADELDQHPEALIKGRKGGRH